MVEGPEGLREVMPQCCRAVALDTILHFLESLRKETWNARRKNQGNLISNLDKNISMINFCNILFISLFMRESVRAG